MATETPQFDPIAASAVAGIQAADAGLSAIEDGLSLPELPGRESVVEQSVVALNEIAGVSPLTQLAHAEGPLAVPFLVSDPNQWVFAGTGGSYSGGSSGSGSSGGGSSGGTSNPNQWVFAGTGASSSPPPSANVQLQKWDWPEMLCMGSKEPLSAHIHNQGNARSASYRVKVIDEATGRVSTSGATRVGSGDDATLTAHVPAGVKDSHRGTVGLDAQLQKKESNFWVTEGSKLKQIDVGHAEFSVENVHVPEYQQPGQTVKAEFTIRNTGTCAAKAHITGSHFQTETVGPIKPNDTLNVENTFSMLTRPATVNAKVQNEALSETQASFSRTVNPEKAVVFHDPPYGNVIVYGGYGKKIPYVGTLWGSGAKGDHLEQTDNIVGHGVYSIEGFVDPSGVDVDEFSFQKASFLQLVFEEPVLFCRDNKVLKKERVMTVNLTPVPSPSFNPPNPNLGLTQGVSPTNPKTWVGALSTLPLPLPPSGGGGLP